MCNCNIERCLIKRIEVVELKENDILVLIHPGRLSQSSYDHITKCFESIPNFNNKVIILEDSMSLSVLRNKHENDASEF